MSGGHCNPASIMCFSIICADRWGRGKCGSVHWGVRKALEVSVKERIKKREAEILSEDMSEK